MTYTVGPKGQVVIPKAIRDELGLEPGDQVEVRRVGETVVVERALTDLRRWQDRFAGVELTAELMADRAAEPR